MGNSSMSKGLLRCARIATALAFTISAATAGAGDKSEKSEKPEVLLQEVVQLMPGHYDNTAQVQSEAAQGIKNPHEAVTLDIVPIEAIMLGENVFYVQESIAGDPNRVLGQKIIMLGVIKKQVVQTDYALTEPHRWRNGQLNPDLFKGMMITDVHSIKGCSMRWKRDDAKLIGTNDPTTCHAKATGAVGVAAVQLRAELSPIEYATAEQMYDKSGHPAQPGESDPFYRFRKISHDTE
jgi:hypothetical protein